MSLWSRRRTRPLSNDSEHEAAERQARTQADFDALLVELVGTDGAAGADRAGEAGAAVGAKGEAATDTP